VPFRSPLDPPRIVPVGPLLRSGPRL
jgi:hypothetical protein